MIMKHIWTNVDFAEALFWTGVVALIVVQFFALSAIGRFYARLRRQYPSILTKVGKPTTPRGPRPTESQLTAFLYCRDFLALRDQALNAFYSRYATLRKVSYLPFAVCALGAMLFIWDKLLH